MKARAKRKRRLYDAVAKLHALHFSPTVIAVLVCRSRATVRRIMADLGRNERWHKPEHALQDLPEDVLKLLPKTAARVPKT